MKIIPAVALIGSVLAASAVPVSAAEDENLVRNGGFEMDASGALPHWERMAGSARVEPGAGRSGSDGVVFESGSGKGLGIPYQWVPVEPGARYKIDVWIKIDSFKQHGNSGEGARLRINLYDAAGKQVSIVYKEGIVAVSPGWINYSVFTMAMPRGVVKMLIAPWIDGGFAGCKVRFDDLRVTHMLFLTSVAASGYRSQSAGGKVVFRAAMGMTANLVASRKPRGRFTVTENATGKKIIDAEPDSFLPDVASLTVDTTLWNVGKYTVRFTLSYGGKTEFASTECERVTTLPKRKRFIDSRNRLIVDGKKVFPLGLYANSKMTDDDIRLAADAGFNCLMPYGGFSKEKMDLCAKVGVGVIYQLANYHTAQTASWTKSPEYVLSRAEEHLRDWKDHPALFAWYLYDEAPLELIPQLRARYEMVKRVDPDHPAWCANNHHSIISSYIGTVDATGSDPYPVNHPLWPMGPYAYEWMDDTSRGTFGEMAIWQIVQIFNKGAYASNHRIVDKATGKPVEWRPPTYEEMRFMTWLPMSMGANGIIYYSFFDLRNMQDSDPFDKRWDEIRRIAAEVLRYRDLILSDGELPQIAGVPFRMGARAWLKDGSYYLLAVNAEQKPQTLAVPQFGSGSAGSRVAEVLFGKPRIAESAASLELEIPAEHPVLLRLNR